MKKRITTEERNKKIFLAIEKIKKNGETPNCKNVAKETNFSETYIFKIVEKEMQKPIGERTQILLELRKHKKSSERKEEILKAKQKFEKKGKKGSLKELAEEIGISENYVYKICSKIETEKEGEDD